jgi:hypothetical protein
MALDGFSGRRRFFSRTGDFLRQIERPVPITDRSLVSVGGNDGSEYYVLSKYATMAYNGATSPVPS